MSRSGDVDGSPHLAVDALMLVVVGGGYYQPPISVCDLEIGEHAFRDHGIDRTTGSRGRLRIYDICDPFELHGVAICRYGEVLAYKRLVFSSIASRGLGDGVGGEEANGAEDADDCAEEEDGGFFHSRKSIVFPKLEKKANIRNNQTYKK